MRHRAVSLLIPALLALAARPAHAQDQPRLIFEHGKKQQVFLNSDDTIRITSGVGWLRFGRLLTDFNGVVQFRTLKPGTDAGLVFRTWASDGAWPLRGYRLALHDNGGKGRELVVGRGVKIANMVTRAEPVWSATREWQTVTVSAAGRFVNVTLNNIPIATFEVENYAGELLFEVAKGEIELRGIRVDDLPTGPALFKQAENVRGPQPVLEVKPQYTQEAMRRKAHGAVLMQALVDVDGSVVGTSVIRSLDGDLDRQAALAARQWKFKPGTRDGRAVPLIVTIELFFTLK